MDFSTVASVGGLVNAAVSTAKTVRDLAKDSSDSKLKASISDLYDALIDVKDKVLDLAEENRSLKTQLEAKDEIEGPIAPHGYFHYKNKPDNPLCPKCLQDKGQRPVFLSQLTQFASGIGRECIVCRFIKIEDRSQRPPRLQIETPPWMAR